MLEVRPARISTRLMLGTALVGTAALLANAAQAQNEQVVVTGTSIRGVQPVGAAVINIDRTTIEETAASTKDKNARAIPVTLTNLSMFRSGFAFLAARDSPSIAT